jgi:hypothetical protein
MLHWSSWWSHSTHDSAAAKAPSPNDPEPWDHDNAVRLQTRFWEHWLDAQRSWLSMYGGFLPAMTAPMVLAAKPAEPDKAEADHAPEPARKHHSPAVERKWPTASGPAGAKLKQQRRRAGLRPNEGPSHH